jgi:O-antigen/teichoic acid export membrane protein
MVNEDSGKEGLVNLTSIFEGAGLFLGGEVVKKGIGFVKNILLTRILGTYLYGIYAYLNVIFSLFIVFGRLGGDNSVMRFLPEYEDEPRKSQMVVTLAYGTSLVASSLVALVVFITAPVISTLTLSDPLFVRILRVSAIVIPFHTLSRITCSIFKGIERMDYSVAVSSLVGPVLRLVFVGGAVLLGFSLIGAVAGLIVSGIITSVFAIGFLTRKTKFDTIVRPSKKEASQYYNFSVPLTFNQLGAFLYNRVDILMVGFFLSSSAVGIYNVAVLLSRLLSLPLKGFGQLFPPIAANLYHSGKHDELNSVYRSVTRIIITISLFPVIVILMYSGELLRIFGENFIEGQLVLELFVLAQLTNAMVGPSGHMLIMSDNQYLTMFNQIASGVFNVFLNYIMILEFGFIGAALATASVLAGINMIRLVEVWYFEGFFPYDETFFKPIIACGGSAIVMYGISHIFDYISLLIVGSSVGFIIYLSLLYWLGISEKDIDMVKGAFE